MINADRSVSVVGDSGVGPYDGGDDTLVGVQNNSSQPVDAITVSGPAGSGIFGFDSDGLCTFIAVPCGATGYEGPGTAFAFDPSTRDRGEVDFGSNGLPGQSAAYFSLEGALNAASIKARQGHLIGRYVALGDSYSSGEGAIDGNGDPSFRDGTATKQNQCHRSNHAYGPLLKADQHISDSDFVFNACSGAIVADFVANLGGRGSGQYTDGPQLDAIAHSGQPSLTTGLVTLSIGGNDAGFPFVLDDCVNGFTHSRSEDKCLRSIRTHFAQGEQLLQNGGTIRVRKADNSFIFCSKACVRAYTQFNGNRGFPYYVVTVPSLVGLYKQVHDRAPVARVRVMQYPHLFPKDPPAKCTVGTFPTRAVTYRYFLTAPEMRAINAGVDQLNQLISFDAYLAAQPGEDIAAFDGGRDFAGHEICSADPWINGLITDGNFALTARPSPFSFHPTATGQRHFADALEASL